MSKLPNPDDKADPRGLIREAFRIDGITEAECRSIFLDWAIGVPAGDDTKNYIRDLLERHSAAGPHPMITVLEAGLAEPTVQGRRGGRRGRVGQ